MLIIKEEKGRKDGEIFVELTRNRDLNVSDCDRLGYWCDKPHLEHFFHTLASVFEHEELEEIFSKILERKQKFEPKDGDILYRKDLCDEWVYVFKNIKDKDFHERHISYHIGTNDLFYDSGGYIHSSDSRPATEEERQLLFDRLKKGDKRWNPEKKRIEDIPEEPKIGDWVIAWQNNRKNEAIIGIIDEKDRSLRPYRLGKCWYPNVILWNGTKEHLEKVRKGDI